MEWLEICRLVFFSAHQQPACWKRNLTLWCGDSLRLLWNFELLVVCFLIWGFRFMRVEVEECSCSGEILIEYFSVIYYQFKEFHCFVLNLLLVYLWNFSARESIFPIIISFSDLLFNIASWGMFPVYSNIKFVLDYCYFITKNLLYIVQQDIAFSKHFQTACICNYATVINIIIFGIYKKLCNIKI